MKIGTVVEGPTDRLMLKAIIDNMFPGKHDYRDLQPTGNGAQAKAFNDRLSMPKKL